METGKYRVINDIHVFDCNLGQLKIAKGKIVEIKEHGFLGSVDGNEFPGRLLDICASQLERII